MRTKFFEQPRTTTDAVTLEKQKQIEERTKRIIKDRKSGVEEVFHYDYSGNLVVTRTTWLHILRPKKP